MGLSESEYVSAFRLFNGINEKDQLEIMKMAEIRETKSGEVLLEESSVGGCMFGIVEGRLDVSLMMPDGRGSETIATLSEGEVIGESVLLGRQRRIAKVVARDDATALEWSGAALTAHFEKRPDIGYCVMKNLAATIHERLTSTNMLLRNTLNRVVDII